MVQLKTEIPYNVAKIIEKLVKKGYYLDISDFARHAIIDKIIEDYEIGLEELEPEIIEKSGVKKEK